MIGRILSPEGALFAVIGIPPEIHVPVFTDADYASGRDGALEAVLERLESSWFKFSIVRLDYP